MNKMSETERERALALARTGTRIEHIASRLGFNYQRMWRCLQRAQERGELPPGNVERLGNGAPKKTTPAAQVAVAKKEHRLRAFAPPNRSAASFLGRCSACKVEPTEIAVEIAEMQFRLCRFDAQELRNNIDLALDQAKSNRSKFNGPSKA